MVYGFDSGVATRRDVRERTFRGLKPTAKVSRRYRGEELLQTSYRQGWV
jgi:hypothetical protein